MNNVRAPILISLLRYYGKNRPFREGNSWTRNYHSFRCNQWKLLKTVDIELHESMLNFIKNGSSGGCSNKATQYDIQECLWKNSLQVFFSVRIYACLLLTYMMMLGLIQRTKLPVHVQAKDIHRVWWLKPAITKMEICPVSLYNTVIDQKHRQGEWNAALQYSQISCLCTY